MTRKQPTRIVIIGAGYAGIWTYRTLHKHLKRELRRGDVQITVICPKNYHSLHGFTAEALCGIVALSNRQNPLRLVMPGAHLVRAYAESINPASQQVTIRMVGSDERDEVPYDHLILANGSYDKLDAVRGMRQFGWSLKESGGVLSSRNHIINMLDYADAAPDPQQSAEALSFVVAGGGFAGAEIAANLAEMLKDAQKLYPMLARQRSRVILVHSGGTLIPEIRPRFTRMAEYATQQLHYWGVDIRLNSRLAEVQSNGAVLSDGTFIPARTVFSTIGQRATVLSGTQAFARSEGGLLLTDPFLHVNGETNVWAGGDSALVMHTNGEPCPANALWAVIHGIHIGRNLTRAIQGKALREFSYRGMGHAASFGIGRGATELLGLQFTGWVAWWLRILFCLYFMPSRQQMVRAMIDWIMLPFLGRYQTSMESSVRQTGAA